MPRLRLGVVLLIPPPVGTEIDALRRAVGDDDVGRMPPHLTLVPPVNVREVDMGAAQDVLRKAASSVGPIRLELGPVTSFAPVSPTIHLGVGGDVDAVHRLRDAVFVDPLERSLTFDFVPHVTLSEEASQERIDAAMVALRDYRVEVVVHRVHIMEETRRDDGSRVWRPIADAPLGGRPTVVGRGGLELELATSEILSPDETDWLAQQWDAFTIERLGEPRHEVSLAVVARRDGRIVGVASGHVRPATSEAYLAELMVAADARNEGIGAHVMKAFTFEAAARGATSIELRTDAIGPARAFYERLGFTERYPLPGWRHGRDFVQLRRVL